MDPIENYEFAASILQRIEARVLPKNTSITKEARQALSKSTLIFISLLTTTALDKKKLSLPLVFQALKTLEFDSSILLPVQNASSVHSALQKQKRDEYRARKAADGAEIDLNPISDQVIDDEIVQEEEQADGLLNELEEGGHEGDGDVMVQDDIGSLKDLEDL